MKVELKKPEQKTLEQRLLDHIRRYKEQTGVEMGGRTLAKVAAEEAEKNPAPDNFPATLTITVESLEEAWVLRALIGLTDAVKVVQRAHESHRRELRSVRWEQVSGQQMALFNATLELTK